jgi:hypothetical protein
MKNVFLFFILLPLNSLALENARELGMLKGTELSLRLARVRTYGELKKIFRLSVGDQKSFDHDLKKKNFSKKKLPKFTYNDSVITFHNTPGETLFDFKEIASNKLHLNGKQIDLSNPISYLDAIKLVRNILGKDKKTALLGVFLPYAMAAENENSFESLWALIISSSLNPEDLKLFSSSLALEKTIIQTYSDFVEISSTEYFPKFKCSGSRLSEISKEGFESETRSLTYTPGTGFKGKYLYVGDKIVSECSFETDDLGTVTLSKGEDRRCTKVGDKIFEIENRESKFFNNLEYGDYPKVADACCRKKGCPEEVDAGIARVDSRLQKSREEERKENGVKGDI